MRVIAVTIGVLFGLPALAAVSLWIPFDSDAGHISIPVTMNGVQTRAILDSGASGNGVSERFLAEHDGAFRFGRQTVVVGVHGRRKVRLIDDIDIEMFGAFFNIDGLMPLRIHTADLVVGLPFLSQYVLQIDYPNSRIRTITPNSIDMKGSANVRMKQSGDSQPVVKVNLNDEYTAWLTLDTGNNSGILMPRSVPVRFGWLDEYGTVDIPVGGVTRVASNEAFNLPRITIGPFTLENVIVMVPGEGSRTFVGRESAMRTGTRIKGVDSDGILGYDILKHFVVTIDFRRSLLHMAPPDEG